MIEPDSTITQEKSWIVLETLICLLREKNLLKRADIEDLCARVEQRAAGLTKMPLPCCPEKASIAAADLSKLGSYIGQRYGGKHKH